MAPPVVVHHEGAATNGDAPRQLAVLERERSELESELELVRTRATELQEVVNQQRRELAEQRTEITNELRLLREMAAQWPHATEPFEPQEEADLVGASSSGESMGAVPDPVVSSVMAQFARLQKDAGQQFCVDAGGESADCRLSHGKAVDFPVRSFSKISPHRRGIEPNPPPLPVSVLLVGRR